MNCSRCLNSTNTLIECNLCEEKFCSNECYQYHNQDFHQSNLEQSQIDNSINNNNSFINYARSSHYQSPFLVKGVMNYDYIRYDPIYSPDNFTLIYSNGVPKSIGNGSFGQVYLAINNIDKKTYAIKHMEKERLFKYLNCLDPIYAEIDIQSRVNHPNIIRLLYVRETESTFDLVMDYAKDGTLFEYVVKNKGLPEKIAFKYFIQIVNAIKFLHDNNVIHRDIKPENILLFDNDVAKLCDFGWSIKCVDRLPGGSFSGTTEYMAPELINNLDYGKEIDIWMLGILLYELMHGFSPFRPKKPKFEEKEVVYNIQTHNINFYMPVSDVCKELIFHLLETNVNKRCTIDEIFSSKFVRSFEKEENDISSSYLDKNENKNENSEKNNRISNSNKSNLSKNIDNNQNDDSMQISKSQLLNRYAENEELNDSRRIIEEENSNNKNYEFINIKRIESDILSNSKISQTENIILNDNKENIENSLDIDDPWEDEPNAPKNNQRNRIKKQNIHNSITKLNFNFNNENILSPLKKEENESQKNTITNSPKNNNKNRKKNIKNNLNFDLNPNTVLNNNLLTSRRKEEKEKEKEKEKLQISEDHSLRKRSVLITESNKNEKQNQNGITNYIFNNNKEINIKPKILSKKLTLNSNNQLLSLSLSPGTGEYSSLLRSISPDKPFIFPKDKNDFINNNYKCHFPVDISDNWSNTSQNIKEYPFDHLASNSSLDIRKPKYNNKTIKNEKNIYIENDDDEEIMIVKEKEPNDNMRRKNKNKNNIKKEEIPRDNIMKNNRNIKPRDNNKKSGSFVNDINIQNSNNINFEKKATNSAINETVSLNNYNCITKSIIKKIKDNNNNVPSKSTSIRNFSVSTTDDLRTKRQNSDDFNKNPFSKNENNIIIKQQNKDINNSLNNNQEIIFINNLKGALSPKSAKSNKINDNRLPLKTIGNKNMSFVSKNKNQVLVLNNDRNKNNDRRQKGKKGGSVNKQIRGFSQFNKNRNSKKEVKPIKYYKSNISKNTNIANPENIKNKEIKENKCYSEKKKDIIENKKNNNIEIVKDNIKNENKDNLENKNDKNVEINKDNIKIENEGVLENKNDNGNSNGIVRDNKKTEGIDNLENKNENIKIVKDNVKIENKNNVENEKNNNNNNLNDNIKTENKESELNKKDDKNIEIVKENKDNKNDEKNENNENKDDLENKNQNKEIIKDNIKNENKENEVNINNKSLEVVKDNSKSENKENEVNINNKSLEILKVNTKNENKENEININNKSLEIAKDNIIIENKKNEENKNQNIDIIKNNSKIENKESEENKSDKIVKDVKDNIKIENKENEENENEKIVENNIKIENKINLENKNNNILVFIKNNDKIEKKNIEKENDEKKVKDKEKEIVKNKEIKNDDNKENKNNENKMNESTENKQEVVIKLNKENNKIEENKIIKNKEENNMKEEKNSNIVENNNIKKENIIIKNKDNNKNNIENSQKKEKKENKENKEKENIYIVKPKKSSQDIKGYDTIENNVYKEIIHKKNNTENKIKKENLDLKEKEKEKEIKQNEIISSIKAKQNNIIEHKIKRSGIRLNKKVIPNSKNIKNINKIEKNNHIIIKKKIQINQNNDKKEKINQTEIIKDIDNKDKDKDLNKENQVIKTIEIEKEEKEPKDKIRKTFKKVEKKYSKEKRYTKVKIDPKKKENLKNLQLNNNNNNNIKQKNKFPRKVNTKPKQNNEQLTDSSIYEYAISQNKEENKNKCTNNTGLNNSNSESKTTSYSKSHISNIKEKIKSFSVLKNEDINIKFSKAKSPDARKQYIYKNKLEKKDEILFKVNSKSNNNIKQTRKFSHIKNVENIIDDKNIEIKLENNKKIIENDNKENIEINKRINNKKVLDKNKKKREFINISVKNKDVIKKSRKKHRKVKSNDNLKEDNDKSEKLNNDSESFIIDGDSEYGDSEIF